MARAGTLPENAYFHETRQQAQPKTRIRLTIDTDEDNDRYDEILEYDIDSENLRGVSSLLCQKKERKEREKKK